MAFQVIPPNDDPQTNNANWRNLNQNIQAGFFDPLGGGNPGITGTGLLVQGYFSQVLTGVLHFNITMTVTSGTVNIAWPNLAFLTLPTPVGQLGSAGGGLARTVATLSATGTGATIAILIVNNSGKNGILQNTTGATITSTPVAATIQGFYFTGK